ncbi:valine--tRNA ligase [Candidatus Peregrinibacteria bacterium]|nr:valine--tRNA ligase [Candidatus Peregrinibacteria bacterium]
MKDIPKTYEASQYEDDIYELWEVSGAFTPKIDSKKKPFTIAMPPPNATGTLHLGHASMLAIEDIMIRFKRMQGFCALWIPGTDHAAIATQTKVEQILLEQGITRHDLGREEFLKRVHEFVEASRGTIRNQIRRMGSSCDWSRERYTLDEGLSRAVAENFVKMYRDGLIYRGHRIVNWCPRCSSTLADDEVVYKELQEKLYYIKYGPLSLATARPETKFGDTAVAVHPKDNRYKKYIGKKIAVTTVLGETEMIVVADSVVDPKFGTGVIKVTPAHDATDFDIGKRHGLEVRQVIDENGRMNEKAGKYAGMTTREARVAVVKDMKKLGLLIKEEDYTHNLSLCYRCSTPIEPLVSLQWFIDVNKPILSARSIKLKKKLSAHGNVKKEKLMSIKEKSIEVIKNGSIKIIPDRFEKIYFNWMENLRDWCISRQIWFGHRIPVYYCLKCMEASKEASEKCHFGSENLDNVVSREPGIFVSADRLTKCLNCSKPLKQDPDTLDTWFSSGQWTFATLGWPEKTADLQYFHPTSVLETGYDILFFWVARMIIMTTYAMGEVPFETVYLHGLIRDKEGKKMSKSSGNGIDPLDMIAKYGADAVRLSLVVGSTPGNDIRLYEEKIAGCRNFINKIWNAARFAMGSSLSATPENHSIFSQSSLKTFVQSPIEHIEKKSKKYFFGDDNVSILFKHSTFFISDNLSLSDKWILTRLQRLIEKTTNDLEAYRFSDAGLGVYEFTWNEFCDWYLECSKVQPHPQVLQYVLMTILKLAHPFVPFVTEAIWKHLCPSKHNVSSNAKNKAFTDESSNNGKSKAFATELSNNEKSKMFATELLNNGKSETLSSSHRKNQTFESESLHQKECFSYVPNLLIASQWPQYDKKLIFTDEESDMQVIFNVITGIRKLRAESHVAPHRKIHAIISGHKKSCESIESQKHIIQRMAGLERLDVSPSSQKISDALSLFVGNVEVYLPLKNMMDFETERKRLQEECKKIASYIQGLETKLLNKNFIQRAPKNIVEKEKEKLETARSHLQKIEEQVRSFDS